MVLLVGAELAFVGVRVRGTIDDRVQDAESRVGGVRSALRSV